MPVNNGPIPGENFTADTKNFPWHKPPEFVDLDKALDMLSEKVSDWSVAASLLSMADVGIPLYKVSQTLIMAGVYNGKWTLDLGLLIVGPLTRILELLCQGFEVEYVTGLDDEPVDFTTGTFFKTAQNAKMFSDQTQGFQEIKSQMEDIKSSAEEQTPTEMPEASPEGGPQEGSLPQMGFMVMKGMK